MRSSNYPDAGYVIPCGTSWMWATGINAISSNEFEEHLITFMMCCFELLNYCYYY